MNQNFNNLFNPLHEHLISQETIRKQNNLLGYFLAFCLGALVCYVVIKSMSSPVIQVNETEMN
jgi:hypothetical protein